MSIDHDDEMDLEYDPREIAGPWVDRFIESEIYKGLDESLKDQAAGIIEMFSYYAFEQLGDKPTQWNTSTVEECCLEVLPRKVAEESPYFQAVGPVLAAFFRFLDAERILPKAGRLARVAEEISPQIVKTASDPSNWGMAKTFTMDAISAGVDVRDQEALDRYVIQYNERMAQQLDDLPEPKRSDAWFPNTIHLCQSNERRRNWGVTTPAIAGVVKNTKNVTWRRTNSTDDKRFLASGGR